LGCENAGLASAHSIADGLTELEPTHHYYHGEKVAIGTLASLFLTDKPKATIDEVFSFCECVSLPTTFADIGLAGITDEELMLKVLIAISCTPRTNPFPLIQNLCFLL
jgi:glycerol dehydrogenase